MSFPLSNILLARAKITGVIVSNDDVNDYFVNRATGSPVLIVGSTEYLTGIYQQPDVGSCSDSIHDLTEGEITNLAAGTDCDGLGSNVPWSTLEKAWILAELEVSSSDSTLRYGFNFQNYDSAISTVFVANSGALGMNPINDRLKPLPSAGGYLESDWTPNTGGLADDWETTGAGTPTTSIVTGNGFTGNAQRCEASGATVTLRNAVNISADYIAVRLFKYRASANFTLQSVVSGTPIASTIISANTGNAISSINSFAVGGGVTEKLEFIISDGEWIEIDEVEVRNTSLTPSDNGAADWLNPTDGLAENWSPDPFTGLQVYSIVTGNGFNGNAQRCDNSADNSSRGLKSDLIPVTNGADYILSYKFRGGGGSIQVTVYNESDFVRRNTVPGTNTGDAEVSQSTVFTANTDNLYIIAEMVSSGSATDWLEIDEIELLEVPSSESISSGGSIGNGIDPNFTPSGNDSIT